MREERPRRSAVGARRGSESVELCEVGDEQQGGEGVEVEGAVVTEGEDDHGGAIEGGEGGEDGVEHSRERINEVGNGGEGGVFRGDERVCRRAAGGVFRGLGDGAQRLRECAAKGGSVLTVQR